jgi:hypothetical protein
MEVLVMLIWIVGCPIACGVIAQDKGRSGPAWFGLGLVFGLLALVMIACLSRVEHSPREA